MNQLAYPDPVSVKSFAATVMHVGLAEVRARTAKRCHEQRSRTDVIEAERTVSFRFLKDGGMDCKSVIFRTI